MSEMFQYFPTAVYGKSGDSGKVPEGYRWLERSSDFPDSAYDWADKYAKSFQWVSNASKSLYEPVTAWVPLDGREGGGLFFQILDMGYDDRGRPHTLRMMAAFVSAEAIRDNPDLLLLLLLASSQGVDSDAPIEYPSAVSPEIKNQLDEFRTALRQSNLDLANHAVLLTTDPDTFSLRPLHPIKVFNRSSRFQKQELPAMHPKDKKMQINSTLLETRQINQFYETIRSQSKSITWNKLLIIFSIIINILLFIYNTKLNMQNNELNGTIRILKNDNELFNEKNNQLESKLHNSEEELKKSVQKLANKDEILNKLKTEIANKDEIINKLKTEKEKWISANAPEETNKEIARLKNRVIELENENAEIKKLLVKIKNFAKDNLFNNDITTLLEDTIPDTQNQK